MRSNADKKRVKLHLILNALFEMVGDRIQHLGVGLQSRVGPFWPQGSIFKNN